MNIIRKVKAYLQLREAVRRADKAHIETGERYYVMPSMDGKLIIMDRKNFRKLKQKGYIDHRIKINDLIAESFYFTSYNSGKGYITTQLFHLKQEAYYSWIKKQKR